MMVPKKKVCVITGSRSEYGILYWLIKSLQDDPNLELQLVVTGMHLSPEFGMSEKIIEKDSLSISYRVEMLLSSDSNYGTAKATGLGTIGFADCFRTLKPDIVIVLGDRFEILSAVVAAMLIRIPVAHLHGGELTEGAVDDAIRHAITKMSRWHFVAAEAYRWRVIQMGEPPDSVFNVGTPGLEHLMRTKLVDRAELEAVTGCSFGKTNFLVVLHPETLSHTSVEKYAKELFSALESFADATFFFSKSNADPGARQISDLVDAFVATTPGRSCSFVNLGSVRYLSLLKSVDIIIGNSSSGILEAPAMNVPSVNIGDRQKGRLLAASVLNSDFNRDNIRSAIEHALSKDFRSGIQNQEPPYGRGQKTAERIVGILKSLNLENADRKTFLDIPQLLP